MMRYVPKVTIDYGTRHVVDKARSRAVPTNAEVWVCPTCEQLLIETAKVITQGRIHLTGTGDICDNGSEFTKHHLPDAVIAAYMIGGWVAIRDLVANLKTKQPEESPPAADDWPEYIRRTRSP